MSIRYQTRRLFAVICNVCEDEGPDAFTKTVACDRAKDEGWTFTGNANAYCPDCGDPDHDPTPYETGEPDNLPREAQERAQENLKFKR